MLIIGLILTLAMCSTMAIGLFVAYEYLEAWIFTGFACFIALSLVMVSPL